MYLVLHGLLVLQYIKLRFRCGYGDTSEGCACIFASALLPCFRFGWLQKSSLHEQRWTWPFCSHFKNVMLYLFSGCAIYMGFLSIHMSSSLRSLRTSHFQPHLKTVLFWLGWERLWVGHHVNDMNEWVSEWLSCLSGESEGKFEECLSVQFVYGAINSCINSSKLNFPRWLTSIWISVYLATD